MDAINQILYLSCVGAVIAVGVLIFCAYQRSRSHRRRNSSDPVNGWFWFGSSNDPRNSDSGDDHSSHHGHPHHHHDSGSSHHGGFDGGHHGGFDGGGSGHH